MTRLPVVSGKECIRSLQKLGFRFIRREGSHVILRREHPYAQVVVPEHKELDRGTLRAIIRQTGVGLNDFLKKLAD